MKKCLFILLILFLSVSAYAGHIAGGEIFYRYIGPTPGNPNSSRYLITVRLFRECNPPPNQNTSIGTADMPTSVPIAIYNNTSPSTVVSGSITVPRKTNDSLKLNNPDPCIILPSGSNICYIVGTYEQVQDLPNTANGYVVAFQTCCRTYNVANVQTFPIVDANGVVTSGEGATYTCEIPGSNRSATTNSSAVFALKDTTLICNFSPFNLDFSATDPDADSLSYSLCSAFDRGNTINSSFPAAGYSLPPYNNITYTTGFSGSQPLGAEVSINPVTGIISGIAPAEGRYVVSVCIAEWKNGQVIRQHRKDFTLIVKNCNRVGAALKPSYITCDGYTLSFENQSTNPSISAYLWDFGDKNAPNPTSTQPTPTHTYTDTGTYTVKLTVQNTVGCKDSATAPAKVYPGFTTDFTVEATCVLNPYVFKDATVTQYGVVDSWRWDFGDNTTTADTARARDSAWKYTGPQTVQVRLITTNSKGCTDSITKPVTILDKPQLSLPFRDTLICSIDTLALRVNISSGSANWTVQPGPNQSRIVNQGSTSPLVYPTDTTKYYVVANDNGCINTDSVTVNVLQFISVDVRDTGICRTDTFRLQPVSHALSYQWTASTGETIQGIRSPLVRPLVNTQYNVVANLGKCEAKDSMQVTVAPYPLAAAGQDQIICYGTRVQLAGTITGSSFNWSPTISLVNQNTLTPTAGPTHTTTYILTATNTAGCLKPKSDTVVVTVIPPITAYAGRDTTIAAGQPLQLEATGGTGYVWTPTTGLNNPNIYNPIATLDDKTDSITYTVRVSEGSCFADDQVVVRVFKTGADILVPSGFTPNGDGRNDDIRPFTVGISQLTYFSIYNRWGQLIFTTSQIGKTWDGNFNGVKQPPGTYVYQALGIDFAGNSIYRKGTIVLIR
jgi:gliding motility-associated-like protein